MKTLRNHGRTPASVPLVADDVLEFHAGRIVLLLAATGKASAINGLTKLAKLDFFVRYPDFFSAIVNGSTQKSASRQQAVEAAMIRYHYGPWDKRYYHVLAFLEAREVVSITRSGKSFRISLTVKGKSAARQLGSAPAFATLNEQIQKVTDFLGGKTGSQLKQMIYSAFDEEVGKRLLGETIKEHLL